MIKRRQIYTRQLKPGMKVDHPVVDRMGRNLVARGAQVDEYVIESMLKLGIMTVYIQEGEEDPENDEPKLSEAAKRNVEKYRTEDRSKVKLSDSVRKRVSEGIQFIYSNTDSPELTDTTNSIAGNLLSAIDENDAIAIDISTLKTSDEYTFKHSVDVATIGMVLGKSMGLSQTEIYEIGITGLLHDVGKTKVPIEILNKPGRLDDDEFAIMKQHSVFGYRIIKERNDYNDSIALGVLQHHEKMNGKGYPIGVDAAKICPYAKILSVADIYDALVTERPYKSAFSQRDAVEMIMSMTSELDMTAMKAFLESMILYPVDSYVELSNGETARVVKNNPHYILRPTVVGVESGKLYDLGEDISCASIIIK
jgi:HD-GYP domain-containing protein (c-di-GMP phosphodiesterase class II)